MNKQIIGGRGSAKFYTTLNTIEVMLENEKLKESLKRKEQECEGLRYEIGSLENDRDILQEQLDRLKAELEVEKNWHKIADEISKANSEYTRKLKQALIEIKKIAQSTLDCGEWIGQGDNKIEQILQTISEVENDNA